MIVYLCRWSFESFHHLRCPGIRWPLEYSPKIQHGLHLKSNNPRLSYLIPTIIQVSVRCTPFCLVFAFFKDFHQIKFIVSSSKIIKCIIGLYVELFFNNGTFFQLLVDFFTRLIDCYKLLFRTWKFKLMWKSITVRSTVYYFVLYDCWT